MFDGWKRMLNVHRGMCVQIHDLGSQVFEGRFSNCSMTRFALWESKRNEYINLVGKPIKNVAKPGYFINQNRKMLTVFLVS